MNKVLENKNIAVVHPNPNRLDILSLKKAGANIYLISDRDHELNDLVTSVKANPYDYREIEDTLLKMGLSDHINAVVPLWEGTVIETSIISNKLNLNGNSINAAIASRDKYLMSKRLGSFNVRTPKTYVACTYEELEQVAEHKIGYPVILKVPSSTNSQSVIKANNRYELKSGYRDIQSIYTASENRLGNLYNTNRNSIKVLIVQEYVEGKEVNIDLIYCKNTFEVLGIFEKAPMNGPYFAEYRSESPVSLSTGQTQECIFLAKEAVRALGGEIGCAHVEIRYTSNGPTVIEIALRPGGAYTAQAIEQMYGVNVPVKLSELLVSGEYIINKHHKKQACLYGGIVIDQEGVISKVTGTEILHTINEMVTYKILHKEGDYVQPLPKGSDIHFIHYLMVGDDLNKLRKNALLIGDKITTEISKVVSNEVSNNWST